MTTSPSLQFLTIAAIPGERRLLAASTDGIACSDDGGRTWRLLAPQLSGLVETVAAGATPTVGQVLLAAGTGGVFRSDDSGLSWTATLTGSPVLALTMAGNDEHQLIALAGTASDGIFRSLDGGRHWASANAGLFDLEVLALAMSPAFATDNTIFAGTVGVLYRSRNGGQAWRVLNTPGEIEPVQCIAPAHEFDGTGVVLAGTEESGLLRSVDAGETWVSVPDLDALGVTAVAWLVVSPVIAFASTAHGMARSNDTGATWQFVARTPPALSLSAVMKYADEVIVAGLTNGRLIASDDGGASWQVLHPEWERSSPSAM